ncbi:MAG: hypothetical protein IT279_12235 [Ignavibacteriaceae bacterium]|nr:hypothetical protein [Ignavibacteriaceae bacterium]
MKMKIAESSRLFVSSLYEDRKKFGTNETVSAEKLSKLQKMPVEIIKQLLKVKGTLGNPK